MNEAWHEEKVGQLTVKIYYDTNPESPRTWCDHLGEMLSLHSRYLLGDRHATPEEVNEIRARRDVVYVSFRAFAHGQVGVAPEGSASAHGYPFNCPWDSWFGGINWVGFDTIRKEYKRQRVTKKLRARVQEVLRQEIETYNQFCEGDVHGYVVEDMRGECLDSCWGFYGSDYVKEEALRMAEHLWEKIAPTLVPFGDLAIEAHFMPLDETLEYRKVSLGVVAEFDFNAVGFNTDTDRLRVALVEQDEIIQRIQ